MADAHDAGEARTTEVDFRVMFDNIPGFVWTMAPSGQVELVNRQMLRYFGKSQEELKDWSSFLHPDDRARVIALWGTTIEKGEPYASEHRLLGADGRYRWFEGRGIPVKDSKGRITRWYNLLLDIEERKRAEEKLRRSEALHRQAESLGHAGSWSLDFSTGLVSTSPEMARIFGVPESTEGTTPDFWFALMHSEDRQRMQDIFEAAVRAKTEFQIDYRVVYPDGTIRYCHSIGRPILNRSGDLVQFVGTGIDITEQVQARTALESALAEVKALKDQLYKENVALRDEVDRVSMFEEIVGTSPALEEVLSRVVKVAPTDSSVLVTGETGTGKELIARAIHKRSLRAQRAFVSVNCAALASSLISSELFGHEKGAFTGATQRRPGRFELAHEGTLFLDEVGDLPPDAQVKLLRVLQEREFERVGGTETIRVNVRVIAATNRDLRAAKGNGFRADLFYRLNVFPIAVPSLRERRQDIVGLLEYYLDRYSKKLGKTFQSIEKRTIDLLRAYEWPGNVRELQNVVERSVILLSDGVFRIDEGWLVAGSGPTRVVDDEDAGDAPARERAVIEKALAKCRGRVSGPRGAAAFLRVPPSTLDYKIKKLKIDKDRFKLT